MDELSKFDALALLFALAFLIEPYMFAAGIKYLMGWELTTFQSIPLNLGICAVGALLLSFVIHRIHWKS